MKYKNEKEGNKGKRKEKIEIKIMKEWQLIMGWNEEWMRIEKKYNKKWNK